MLDTKESTARVPKEELSWDEILKFASENQRLEGFPGIISEAARRHRPNLEELQAVARRFGAQVPQSLPPIKE